MASSSYSSAKSLLHLVTEQASLASDDVLSAELKAHGGRMARGLRWFGSSTADSRKAFTAAKKKPGKLTLFLVDLAKLIDVEEDKTKQILSAYLAGN